MLINQVLKAMGRAKSNGFSDVIYLDSVNKKYIEEVSSCNIFIVKVHLFILEFLQTLLLLLNSTYFPINPFLNFFREI